MWAPIIEKPDSSQFMGRKGFRGFWVWGVGGFRVLGFSGFGALGVQGFRVLGFLVLRFRCFGV